MVALSAIACVIASLAHEAVGHGGACLLAGGRAAMLSALDLGCDLSALPAQSITAHRRTVAVAGPLFALASGLGAFAYVSRACAPVRHAFATALAWLTAAFLLLANAGYFLFSGATARGDWAILFEDTQYQMGWRLPFVLCGAWLYWRCAVRLLRALGTLAGAARGRRIALIAYITSAAIALPAGALSRNAGPVLAVSGVVGGVASLAAMSALVWGRSALRRSQNTNSRVLPTVSRSWSIVALGVTIAALYVGVLGPGLRLR